MPNGLLGDLITDLIGPIDPKPTKRTGADRQRDYKAKMGADEYNRRRRERRKRKKAIEKID